jgi:hypothetical protein
VEWIRDRGLTLLLMAMFLLFLVGQAVSGFAEYNAEQELHRNLSNSRARGEATR